MVDANKPKPVRRKKIEMPSPCEQKEEIKDMKETIEDVWETISDLEKVTTRIETSVVSMIDEFRSLSRDLRDSLLDGREVKTKIEKNAVDIDNLYKMNRTEERSRDEAVKDLERHHNNDIKEFRTALSEIKSWQDKADGAISTWRNLTIFFSFVTTIVALIQLFR